MSKSNRLDSGEKVHYVSDSNAMMKMKVRKLGGRGHCPRKAKVWDRQLIGQHAPQMIKVVKKLNIIYQSTSTRRRFGPSGIDYVVEFILWNLRIRYKSKRRQVYHVLLQRKGM